MRPRGKKSHIDKPCICTGVPSPPLFFLGNRTRSNFSNFEVAAGGGSFFFVRSPSPLWASPPFSPFSLPFFSSPPSTAIGSLREQANVCTNLPTYLNAQRGASLPAMPASGAATGGGDNYCWSPLFSCHFFPRAKKNLARGHHYRDRSIGSRLPVNCHSELPAPQQEALLFFEISPGDLIRPLGSRR